MPRYGDTSNLKLEIEPGMDEIFDEGANSYLAMRRLRWTEGKDFKLDLRKWFTDKDGQEIAGKGFSFITEEGPHNLATALVRQGFGNTGDILNELKSREDFGYYANRVLGEIAERNGGKVPIIVPENDSGNDVASSYYDPRQWFEGVGEDGEAV